MQTFLPYPSFERSAAVLDYRRLGKQRVEAQQILNAIDSSDYGWQNHPAVGMWRPYRDALVLYRNVMIGEWVSRGYNNTMPYLCHDEPILPDWLGDERLHASHRSNLLRKDPEFYGQYDWAEPNDLPYVWPVV